MKSLLRLFIFVAFTVLNGQLFAQIQHIENRRIYNDTIGWAGQVDANFSALQNRDLLITLGVKPFIQHGDTMHYFLALGDYNYSFGDRLYAHSLLFHLRYNQYFKRDVRWACWEMYAQTQFNPLLSQRIRALAGTGPRFQVMGKRRYKIFTGLSYMYEYQEIIADQSIERNHRGSLYFSWFLSPNNTFTFSGSTYVQPLLTNFSDYLISGQYLLRFRIIKRLNFKFEFGFLYDSRPPQEVRNFIFNAQAGIGIDLTRLGKRNRPVRKMTH